MKNAEPQTSNYNWRRYTSISSLLLFTLVLVGSFLFLLLGMSRRPLVYDEGLILVAAMRVAAGQVPHRDFHANYGPAQFYLIAGFFKLFGETLLIERIIDCVLKAMVVAAVFAIASAYCRRTTAVCTAVITVFWLFFLSGSGSTIFPVSLLNLIAAVLILPVFVETDTNRCMFAAGAVAGAATLFRYDTGIALLGIQALAVLIAIRTARRIPTVRTFIWTFWPCLVAFALVTLPPALYYVSIAPLQPFILDIILMSAKYHSGRNLPFPGITLIGLENLEIYLPVAVILISFYVSLRRRSVREGYSASEKEWHGFLLVFALIALVMYGKGLVRVSIAQMYLSFIPSFLLLAVLFEHRSILSRFLRVSILCIVGLSCVAATWAALHEVKFLYTKHLSVPEWLSSSSRGPLAETNATWCKIPGPLTRGICFLPEDERIQTIEFITSHTQPSQKLFVGLTRHDRIVVNDNLLYFATQRMPATRWSHFDPFLQNTYDIQNQMVHEIDTTAPPYVVLDSEWDAVREPNESANSSGVFLLDEYLRKKYQYTRSFGPLSIWQRVN